MSLPDRAELEARIALELYVSRKSKGEVGPGTAGFTDEDMETDPVGDWCRHENGQYYPFVQRVFEDLDRQRMADPDTNRALPERDYGVYATTNAAEVYHMRPTDGRVVWATHNRRAVEEANPFTVTATPPEAPVQRYRLVTTANQRVARACKREAAEAVQIILS